MATIDFPIKNRWTGEEAVTVQRLRELVAYDPETGEFRWKVAVARRVRAGDLTAQSLNSDGYRHLRLDGYTIKAHRAAWAYVTGSWPIGLIDHADGDRGANRFANLREASRSDNLANSRVHRSGKIDLPKGVTYRKAVGRWVARIQRDGRPIFLGLFDTPEAAAAAYASAAREHFGQFARSA